jgi:hypothetical protein
MSTNSLLKIFNYQARIEDRELVHNRTLIDPYQLFHPTCQLGKDLDSLLVKVGAGVPHFFCAMLVEIQIKHRKLTPENGIKEIHW